MKFYKKIFIGSFLIFIFTATPVVFAAWDGNPYDIGSTLNPECGPTDNNCTVNVGSIKWIADSGNSLSYTSGNVGIGTTSTQEKLQVSGRISADSLGVGQSAQDYTNNSPWYGIGMSNLTLPNAQVPEQTVQVAGYYGLDFVTANGSFVFNQQGNMGIGTTSPMSKLDVAGSQVLSGSNNYLNFGDTAGTGGYGFRDNNGTLEFKDENGSWSSFGSNSGVSQWNSNEAGINYLGTVGIGTTAPGATLEIGGAGSGEFVDGGSPSLLNIHSADQSPWGITFQNDSAGSGKEMGVFLDNNGGLEFYSSGSGNPKNPLSLSQGGKVAIGATSFGDGALTVQQFQRPSGVLLNVSTINNGGSDYSRNDNLGVNGGNHDAVLTVNEVRGPITSVSIANAGSGYTQGDVVSALGGDQSGEQIATLTVDQVDGDGAITQISVTYAGQRYYDNTAYWLGGGTGSSAVVNTTVSSGEISGINISSGGTGYSNNTQYSVTGGSGTGASATFSAYVGTENTPGVTMLDANFPGSMSLGVDSSMGAGLKISMDYGGFGYTESANLFLAGDTGAHYGYFLPSLQTVGGLDTICTQTLGNCKSPGVDSLSTSERNALSSPTPNQIIFNTDTKTMQYYAATSSSYSVNTGSGNRGLGHSGLALGQTFTTSNTGVLRSVVSLFGIENNSGFDSTDALQAAVVAKIYDAPNGKLLARSDNTVSNTTLGAYNYVNGTWNFSSSNVTLSANKQYYVEFSDDDSIPDDLYVYQVNFANYSGGNYYSGTPGQVVDGETIDAGHDLDINVYYGGSDGVWTDVNNGGSANWHSNSVGIDYPSGKVGIGTSTPSAGIDVVGGGAGAGFSEVAHYDTSGPTLDSVVADNKLFTGDGPYLDIFDVTDPVTEHFLTSYAMPGGLQITNVRVEGNMAYVGAQNNYIYILDIRDLTKTPILLGAVGVDTDGSISDLQVKNGFIYVIGERSDFFIFDATSITPTTPLVGSLSPINYWNTYGPTSYSRIAVSGNYAYITMANNNLEILNISNPNSITRESIFTMGSDNFEGGIAVSGNYAYFTRDTNDGESFVVLDVSDPTHPVKVGSADIGSGRINTRVVVSGNKAYVADGDPDSIYVINVSYPNNPIIMGHVPSTGPGKSYGVAPYKDYFFGAEGVEGVIAYHAPTNYSALFSNGNIGVNTNTPAFNFDIGAKKATAVITINSPQEDDGFYLQDMSGSSWLYNFDLDGFDTSNFPIELNNPPGDVGGTRISNSDLIDRAVGVINNSGKFSAVRDGDNIVVSQLGIGSAGNQWNSLRNDSSGTIKHPTHTNYGSRIILSDFINGANGDINFAGNIYQNGLLFTGGNWSNTAGGIHYDGGVGINTGTSTVAGSQLTIKQSDYIGGVEQISNGDFSAGSDGWTLDAGWSSSGTNVGYTFASAPISTFVIDSNGGDYAVGDNYTVDGDSGNALVTVTSVTGVVTGFTLNNPGSGYSIGDVLYISAGNTDEMITVTDVDGSGSILSTSISDFGTGNIGAVGTWDYDLYYAGTPGLGSGANIHTTSGYGALFGLTVLNPGTGYTTGTHALSDGSGFGGSINITSIGSNTLYRSGSLTEGGSYDVSFDLVGGSAGAVNVCLDAGTCSGPSVASSGRVTFTGDWHSGASSIITVTPSNDFNGAIDNISVKTHFISAIEPLMFISSTDSTWTSVGYDEQNKVGGRFGFLIKTMDGDGFYHSSTLIPSADNDTNYQYLLPSLSGVGNNDTVCMQNLANCGSGTWTNVTGGIAYDAGSVSIGNGAFAYDSTTNVTSIDNASIGGFTFPDDAGVVSWIDMNVTADATRGTVESYSANIGGSAVLTVYGESDGSGGVQNMRVGINNSTPDQTFSVNGTVSFNGLSAAESTAGHYLCIDSNGQVVTDPGGCSMPSSRRFKQDINDLNIDSGLAEVMKLDPVSYFYTSEFQGAFSNDINYNSEQVGFIAEDVAAVDSRLVTYEKDGKTVHGVRYEKIVSILAKALQEINSTIVGFAEKFKTKEVDTDKLCVGDTCVTQAEFLQMVKNSGSNPVSQTTSTSTETSFIFGGTNASSTSTSTVGEVLGSETSSMSGSSTSTSTTDIVPATENNSIPPVDTGEQVPTSTEDIPQ